MARSGLVILALPWQPGKGHSRDSRTAGREPRVPWALLWRLVPLFKPTPWKHGGTCHRGTGTQVSRDRHADSCDDARASCLSIFPRGGADTTTNTNAHPVG